MQSNCRTYFTPARLAGYQARWLTNESRTEGNIAYITLQHKGDDRIEAMLDADLLPDVLSLARWAAMRPDKRHPEYVYASGWRRRQPGEPKRLMYLHRLVLELSGLDIAGQHVDHLDGNTLDNRRINLRAGTRSDNARNHHHSRQELRLRDVIRDLLKCPHTRQDCACKRRALAALALTERRAA